jgi:hypothetical protein
MQQSQERIEWPVGKFKYCININNEPTSAVDCRYLSCMDTVPLLASQLVVWFFGAYLAVPTEAVGVN